MGADEPILPVRFAAGPPRVLMVDQTLLPVELRVLELADVPAVVEAIARLAVRGAPAIGIAAASGLCLALEPGAAAGPEQLERVRAAAALLAAARPTAVNLSWALGRCLARAQAAVHAREGDLCAVLRAEAEAIAREEAESCERIGRAGLPLVRDGARVLTHCHTGALATGGIGTAIAPILLAHRAGRRVHVLAGETRPLLQGARLTAWELSRAGVDVALLVDGAAGGLLARGEVDLVLVGADRIARNGDVCNKVGTYGLAVVADRHGVPFWVAAPTSTIDPRAACGEDIPIEERAPEEVTCVGGRRVAPAGVTARNPAFDVTPAELVTGLLTEHGALERPDAAGIARLVARAAPGNAAL